MDFHIMGPGQTKWKWEGSNSDEAVVFSWTQNRDLNKINSFWVSDRVHPLSRFSLYDPAYELPILEGIQNGAFDVDGMGINSTLPRVWQDLKSMQCERQMPGTNIGVNWNWKKNATWVARDFHFRITSDINLSGTFAIMYTNYTMSR